MKTHFNSGNHQKQMSKHQSFNILLMVNPKIIFILYMCLNRKIVNMKFMTSISRSDLVIDNVVVV